MFVIKRNLVIRHKKGQYCCYCE